MSDCVARTRYAAHRRVLGRPDSSAIEAPCVLALHSPIAPARRASSWVDLSARLARARIGGTFNQYRHSELLRRRLREYLDTRADAELLLVGEAAGYRGARVSGIPFTSERQLTGAGPAEATATIVHRVLAELGVGDDVLLWNVVPTHPGTSCSNRAPTRAEVRTSLPFLEELTRGRRVVAVGRLAADVLAAPYVRHPAHGGARAFAAGLRHTLGL